MSQNPGTLRSVATPRYPKIAGLWLFISQNMVILLLTAFDPSI